jgi:hypothetical protein
MCGKKNKDIFTLNPRMYPRLGEVVSACLEWSAVLDVWKLAHHQKFAQVVVFGGWQVQLVSEQEATKSQWCFLSKIGVSPGQELSRQQGSQGYLRQAMPHSHGRFPLTPELRGIPQQGR